MANFYDIPKIEIENLPGQTVGQITDLIMASSNNIGVKMTFADFADFILKTRETAIAGQNQTVIDAINEVAMAISGPLKAATAAAMTDQTKIYVYTGSESGYIAGNWYYYNGSAWTSGGVYNAVAVQTDSTLAIAGMAADAKAAGDAIQAEAAARAAEDADLKSALNLDEESDFKYIKFNYHKEFNRAGNYTKFPIDVKAGESFYLYCDHFDTTNMQVNDVYLLDNNGEVVQRVSNLSDAVGVERSVTVARDSVFIQFALFYSSEPSDPHVSVYYGTRKRDETVYSLIDAESSERAILEGRVASLESGLEFGLEEISDVKQSDFNYIKFNYHKEFDRVGNYTKFPVDVKTGERFYLYCDHFDTTNKQVDDVYLLDNNGEVVQRVSNLSDAIGVERSTIVQRDSVFIQFALLYTSEPSDPHVSVYYGTRKRDETVYSLIDAEKSARIALGNTLESDINDAVSIINSEISLSNQSNYDYIKFNYHKEFDRAGNYTKFPINVKAGENFYLYCDHFDTTNMQVNDVYLLDNNGEVVQRVAYLVNAIGVERSVVVEEDSVFIQFALFYTSEPADPHVSVYYGTRKRDETVYSLIDAEKNARIALADRVTLLESGMESVEQSIEDSADDISALNNDIADLSDDLTALEENKVNLLLTHKINTPLVNNQPSYGVSGQVLRTKGDGSTEWVSVGLPTDSQVDTAVSDWLDNHPEATTTVQDNSITIEKLTDVTKSELFNGYITPQMFGAYGDGVADDTDAIESAMMASAGKYLIIPEGQYLCTRTIEIEILPKKLVCIGTLIYNGTSTFLKLGSDRDWVNSCIDLTLHLINRVHGGTGVELKHVRNSKIYFPEVNNFNIGVKILAIEGGSTNNEYLLGYFTTNNTHLQLECNGNDGWITNNLFLCGTLAKGNIVDPTECTGVKLISNTSSPVSENHFINLNVESLGLGIYVDNARNNYFEKLRTERTIVVMEISNNMYNLNNKITYNYGTKEVVNDGINPQLPIMNETKTVIQAFTPIFSANVLDGIITDANSYHSFNNKLSWIVDGEMQPNYYRNGEITAFVSSVYSYGVKLKCSYNKDFILRQHPINGHPPRIGIILFDSNGNKITNTNNIRCMNFDNGLITNVSYNENMQGGCMVTTAPLSEAYFHVSDNVKKMILFPFANDGNETNISYNVLGLYNEGYETVAYSPILTGVALNAHDGEIYRTSNGKVYISLPSGQKEINLS